jgi:hypothetical protein
MSVFNYANLRDEEALFVWRGLVMLMQLDKLEDWSWNSTFIAILKQFSSLLA